jgi:hypothetical protein
MAVVLALIDFSAFSLERGNVVLAVVLFVCLCLFSVAWAVKGSREAADDGSDLRRQVAERVVEKLPRMQDAMGGSCLICLEELLGEQIVLPCFHAFHASCAEAWLKEKPVCPACRSDVVDTIKSQMQV